MNFAFTAVLIGSLGIALILDELSGHLNKKNTAC
jgi:hypothetical protein